MDSVRNQARQSFVVAFAVELLLLGDGETVELYRRLPRGFDKSGASEHEQSRLSESSKEGFHQQIEAIHEEG